jgi:prevent-host-death family protein
LTKLTKSLPTRRLERMGQVNIYDAKTNLSELVERAAAGEEIIIAKAGKPRARLVAIERVVAERKPGRARGRIRIAADFDAPLPADIAEALGT